MIMNYYIHGDSAKADQIKAAFEKLGYYTKHDLSDTTAVFVTDDKRKQIYRLDIGLAECDEYFDTFVYERLKTHPDYQELELPKPHYDIANFKVGMPVLVREYDTCHWQWVQYSHFNGVGLFFAAGKTWRQCIPFNEDTKHLLGTTDMCPEEYITW